jgi:uroporphyrinogen decarboxylase
LPEPIFQAAVTACTLADHVAVARRLVRAAACAQSGILTPVMASSPLEDFLLAARGGEPERIPSALIVDSPWMPDFAGMTTLDFYLYPDRWLSVYLGVLERFPETVFLPGFWVEYGMATEPSAFGSRISWHPDYPPSIRPLDLEPGQWDRLPRPDPEQDGLMPFVLRRLERLEEGDLPGPHRIHFAAARGPLALAAHVLGTLPFLEATAGEPDSVLRVLEVFTDTVIAFLRAQVERLREPLGILLLDDIPGMLSPASFNAIALPYLQRVFDAFEGLVRIYHNDTPCPHLVAHMGSLHCEVWNFSHAMDIGQVKRAVGDSMALLGNVSPLGTLVRGTPEQVEAEARMCIEKAAAGGRFILSAGGGLSPGTPAANIEALIRAARR